MGFLQERYISHTHSNLYLFSSQGLLRIHLLAGRNLVPKDNLMGGMVKGKSDPYVKINMGGETFTSRVIKGNLNPTWNELYEVNHITSFIDVNLIKGAEVFPNV